MKAICTSACEIAGFGIVQPGEEVELADGFYNDARIRMHFHIVESSVRNKNAKPPDLMADADARRERFAKSLVDHTAQVVALNKIMDFGAEIPRELAETDREGALTEPERIAKIVELWCDNFGYDFPTDEKKPQGDEADGVDKPAKKGKGKKGKRPDGEEQQEESGDTDGGEQEKPDADEPDGEKKPGGADAGSVQQSLFDKLNGK